MVIVKILGTLDLLVAIFFWSFGFWHIIPAGIIAFFAFVILIKGVSFSIMRDFASFGDIVCSLVMFLSLYISLPIFVFIVVSFYLLQKGIFSLL